jgi:cyanophycinase-like exopeptidase
MGGSTDVDAAFRWQISKADGGDFLILRHSGSEGYNDYVYEEMSGETLNSVFTVVLDSAEASEDPTVLAAVENADALFFAGGDQTLYVQRMPAGSPLALALAARAPHITVGGTSAGNDFLSPVIFAPATDAGDVTSKIALADPYAYGIDFSTSILSLDTFGNASSWFADAHFEERDRMGRDLAFLARLHQDGLVPKGQCARFVALNERTAMVVERVRLPRGEAALAGATHAYVCELCAAPATCEAGQPLTAGPYSCRRLSIGDTFFFPDWSSQQGVTYELSVERGVIAGDAYGPPEKQQ